MLYSMTGYGRSEQTIGDKTYLVEVRSLNGKQFDLRLNALIIFFGLHAGIARTAIAIRLESQDDT